MQICVMSKTYLLKILIMSQLIICKMSALQFPNINTMDVDVLVPYVARLWAAIILIMQDEWVLVCHE